MPSMVRYGIVLTLYLLHIATSYSILSILPSHVPCYPFPTQHLTIQTYTHYPTSIPIPHYKVFIFSSSLIYSPRSYIYIHPDPIYIFTPIIHPDPNPDPIFTPITVVVVVVVIILARKLCMYPLLM